MGISANIKLPNIWTKEPDLDSFDTNSHSIIISKSS